MRIRPALFSTQASPPPNLMRLFGAIPFLILVAGYVIASEIYLAANPGGRILPSLLTMAERFYDVALNDEGRTPFILWADTMASLIRLASGLALAAVVGLLVGINMGLFPGMRSILLPSVVALSFVPTLAMLPILLIVVGIGEMAKITLVFLGLVFFITRDMYAATTAIPAARLDKARTLGATDLSLTYRVVMPMILPRLFETVRQSLGPAWLFLIAGEGIAASEGLGYRIFTVRKYFDMATIIPYVIWITLLAFVIYYLMMYAQQKLCPWNEPQGAPKPVVERLFAALGSFLYLAITTPRHPTRYDR